jgi:endonuclease/exonuclease/phosphatase family metal-dependent hydrolase
MSTGERRIRIASYNVHRCIGGDGRCDPARIASVLRELEADVVALQEVDSDHWVRGGIDQLVFLAEAVGFEAAAGPTVSRGSSHYGNALLTRWPLRRVRQHDLTVSGREPRCAIDAEVDVDGALLRVVATHLGLGQRERRRQLRMLAGLMDGDSAERVILLGDMNEWIPGALQPLNARLAPSPRLRTFPARRPLLALDRIWVRPRGALQDARVHWSRAAAAASDHLPLVASLVIG